MRSKQQIKHLQLFGNHIRNLRSKKGYSLRKMQQLSGIDHSTIAKIEAGNINIRLTTMMKLAEALQIKLGDILPRY